MPKKQTQPAFNESELEIIGFALNREIKNHRDKIAQHKYLLKQQPTNPQFHEDVIQGTKERLGRMLEARDTLDSVITNMQ